MEYTVARDFVEWMKGAFLLSLVCCAVALVCCAVALTGAIWHLEEAEQRLAGDCDGVLKATITAEEQIGVAAQNIDGLVSDARPGITASLENLRGATGQLELTSANLNLAAVEINRPCGDSAPCGTLADVAKTLNTFRGTAGQLEVAANHEDSRLTLLDAQEQQLADQSATDLIKLGSAIDSITALTGNKDLTGSLAHLDTTSGAVAGMATDTEQYWHSVLHPKLAVRIYHAITGVGIDALKVLGF